MLEQYSGASAQTLVDLDLIAPASTAPMAVLHPVTGEAIGLTFLIAGPDHPKTIEIQDAAARRQAKKDAQAASQAARGRNGVISPDDPEAVRTENIRVVAGRILGWTPEDVKLGGVMRKYSPEAAFDLLYDRRFGWIFLQVLEFISGEASFMKASAKA